MSIMPIQTQYDGYLFRSRLEARWAVFFDNAKIAYEYEPEGFDLNGDYYLPDFYLPDFQIYVEIKPFRKDVVHHVGDGNQWEKKCMKFRDYTGKAILICYGDPATELYHLLFAFDVKEGDSAGSSEWLATFAIKHNTRGAFLLVEPNTHGHYVCIDEWFNTNPYVTDEGANWDTVFLNRMSNKKPTNIIDIARIQARQARFEFQ